MDEEERKKIAIFLWRMMIVTGGLAIAGAIALTVVLALLFTGHLPRTR